MPIEFEWKLSLDQLAKLIPNRKLGDPQVKVDLATGSVAALVAPEESGLTFTLDEGATAVIEAFNSENDLDIGGVVGPVPQPGSLEPGPALVFGSDGGWLKYAALVRVKAKAGVELPYLAASGEAEASVLIADYRRHALTDNVRDAVIADVTSLRVPFRADHVAALQVGDALALQARARLQASVKVSWSDVFTSNLSRFAALLPPGQLVQLKTTVGASVAAAVGVTDELLLTFVREDAAGVVVTVKKAAWRTAKVTPTIGVKVEWGDENALGSLLGAAYEALVGRKEVQQFETALDKWLAGNLSPELKELLAFVLDRFGLDFDKANPQATKQLWAELKAKVKETLLDLAQVKVEAAFAYEYARISEDQVLTRFVIPVNRLATVHRKLLVGKLGAALIEVGDTNIRSYLRQKSTKASSAWGFALGFKDAMAIEGRDAKSLRESVEYASRHGATGPRRIAYRGTRGYKGSLFGVSGSWACDFKADMKDIRSDPSAADFEYGLYLQIAHEGGLSGNGLAQATDEAVVWRAFDDADAPEVVQAITHLVPNGNASSRLELKIGNAEFRQILPLLATGDAKPFGRALARAMPWDGSTARRFVQLREGHYDDLWFTYLFERAQDWTPERAGARTYERLRKISLAKNYAYFEKTCGPNSLADVLDKNARTGQGKYSATFLAWQSMVAGAAILRDAIAQRQHPTVFKTVFGRFEDLWTQSFHTKAFGGLLLDLAAALPGGLSAIEVTFTVEVPDKEALVFSTARA